LRICSWGRLKKLKFKKHLAPLSPCIASKHGGHMFGDMVDGFEKRINLEVRSDGVR
jgi:hypothetical protein